MPFVTGQYVTNGSNGSNNPFQTIEREDVGLKLNIRPQISEGGTVKLDIYQEVSSIDESRSSITNGIVTNKRAIDTSVLVDDARSSCWAACWKTASRSAPTPFRA